MANAAASKPNPLSYQTQRAIVLRSADADVVKLLRELQADVTRMLREVAARPKGIGRDIREAQLRLVQRNLHAQLGETWRRLGDITQARRAEAAARASAYSQDVNTFRLVTGGLADGADIAQAIYDSEIHNAASGLDRMIARTSGASYVPLKDRVYNSEVNIGSKVDKLVNSALARGLSAVEFASEVRQFINPATPGGVRYAAMRLARTEINNAAHAMAIESVRDTPWVEEMQWTLSGSHGRPDICDAYAKGGPNSDGRYPKRSVPTKPHPHCLCYPIAITDDDEEFERKLLGGEYNQYLDKYRNLQPGQVVTTSFGGFVPPAKLAPPIKATKAVTPKPAKAVKPKPPSAAAPPVPGATAAVGTIEQQQIDYAKKLLNSGTRQSQAFVNLSEKFGIPQNKALHIVLKAQKEITGTGTGAASQVVKAAVAPVKKVAGRAVSESVRITPLPTFNNSIGELRRKVQLNGPDKQRIIDEYVRQAQLVPKTAEGLEGVEYATAAENARYGASESALAYYVPGKQRIFLKPEIFQTRYLTETFAREVRTGFCSRAGAGVGGDQAVFAHEFGHHVADAVLRLSRVDRDAFVRGIAEDLDLPLPKSGTLLREPGDEWMKANKAQLASKVSKYGASEYQELLAEIWHEYSTNPNARAWIKKAGARMRKVSES